MRSECAFADLRTASAPGAAFDFQQRKIEPRLRDAFDKCPVLEIKNSALFLAIADSDIKDIKHRRTHSLQSKGFDFIQTDSRKSAGFLIFNQSFLFKEDSENAESGGRKGRAARSHSRNSPNELKDGQNAWPSNSLRKHGKARPGPLAVFAFPSPDSAILAMGSGPRHDRVGKILYPQSLKTVN